MNDHILKENFLSHLYQADYPCVMARSALLTGNIHTIIADAFCPAPSHVKKALTDIYATIDKVAALPGGNHSIALLFRTPEILSEEHYDSLFWPFVQCLHDLDRAEYNWDPSVSFDPENVNFSFSLKGTAFYLIGMHNKSSRKARSVPMPAITFNLHRQFEELREKGKYDAVRDNIRRRDVAYAGNLNPLLQNFGDGPEVLQYTGRQISKENWVCPFQPHQQATY